MDIDDKLNIHKNIQEVKAKRIKDFHDSKINATCLSGLSISYDEPVRVLLLLENLMMAETLPMEDNKEHFKLFGLPMSGIYKGNGQVELNHTSELLLNEKMLNNKSKQLIDIKDFIHQVQEDKRGFTVYAQKCHFSIALIDENVYQATKDFNNFNLKEQNYNEELQDFNDLFYKIDNLKVEYKEVDKDPIKNESILNMRTEFLKTELIEEHFRRYNSYFYNYKDLLLNSIGKNQYNLFNAFYALDILNLNSFHIKPMTLINNNKLSTLKIIQKSNLEKLDEELNKIVSYKIEQIPCVKISDIIKYEENIIFNSGTKDSELEILNFEGESKIFKRNDLFPICEHLNDDSKYIKIINDKE